MLPKHTEWPNRREADRKGPFRDNNAVHGRENKYGDRLIVTTQPSCHPQDRIRFNGRTALGGIENESRGEAGGLGMTNGILSKFSGGSGW